MTHADISSREKAVGGAKWSTTSHVAEKFKGKNERDEPSNRLRNSPHSNARKKKNKKKTASSTVLGNYKNQATSSTATLPQSGPIKNSLPRRKVERQKSASVYDLIIKTRTTRFSPFRWLIGVASWWGRIFPATPFPPKKKPQVEEEEEDGARLSLKIGSIRSSFFFFFFPFYIYTQSYIYIYKYNYCSILVYKYMGIPAATSWRRNGEEPRGLIRQRSVTGRSQLFISFETWSWSYSFICDVGGPQQQRWPRAQYYIRFFFLYDGEEMRWWRGAGPPSYVSLWPSTGWHLASKTRWH